MDMRCYCLTLSVVQAKKAELARKRAELQAKKEAKQAGGAPPPAEEEGERSPRTAKAMAGTKMQQDKKAGLEAKKGECASFTF